MDAIGWSKPQVVELLSLCSLCSLCFSDYCTRLSEQFEFHRVYLKNFRSALFNLKISAAILQCVRRRSQRRLRSELKPQSNWSRIKDELALNEIAFARTPYRANWNPRTLRKSLNASNRREMRRAWEELRRTEENYRSRMAPPARVPVTKAISRLIPALQRL